MCILCHLCGVSVNRSSVFIFYPWLYWALPRTVDIMVIMLRYLLAYYNIIILYVFLTRDKQFCLQKHKVYL